MRYCISLIVVFLNCTVIMGTPFPVKGEIYNAKGQQIAMAHVYPRYVEIFVGSGEFVGKVGIMVESGIAKLFLVSTDKNGQLVGYGNAGRIFDSKNNWIGSYFWTPTYSFIYNRQGERLGKVKCIAWPRVCVVGVGGFLLHLF